MKRARLLIAAGGTAGHMLAALSLAQNLVQSGVVASEEVCFIGSGRGIEDTVFASSPFRVIRYKGRGIDRGSPASALSSTLSNLFASLRILPKLIGLRPSVVVSFGGYYSAMPALVGRFGGAQVVTVEQNAVMGLANRFCASMSQVVCVPPFFRRGDYKDELVVTGNPVRPEVVEMTGIDSASRQVIREGFGVGPEVSMVLAFGGSLGAQRLNDLVLEAVPLLNAGFFVYLVTGDRDLDRVSELCGRVESDCVLRLAGYDSELIRAMAAADLVLARSGASTIAELAIMSQASILIPLPGSPYDHQQLNAESVRDVGGAVVLSQDGLTGAQLASSIVELTSDKNLLAQMGASVSTLAVPDATERLAKVVNDLLDPRRRGRGGRA